MRRISNEMRKEVIRLLKCRLPQIEVAVRSGVGKSTVGKIALEISISGEKNRGGRKLILSERKKSLIIRKYESETFQRSTDGQNMLRENFGLKVSQALVRDVLKKNGLKCYKKQTKPLLLSRHKSGKLGFCLTYQSWSYFDWIKVVWSDESKFNLEGSDRRSTFWMSPSNEKRMEIIIEKSKFGVIQ
jgi:transposase